MIGTLGRKIIFEVSDNRVLTFESMSREVSGRWTEHEVLGVKPKAEFLGPGLQTISLTIHLSAALGVKPRRILDMVERMVERGSAEYLVIGGRLVGRRPFRVTGSSEAWDKVYSRGELAKAKVKRTLIAESLLFYAQMGTPAAVNRIIETIFQAGHISEWWEYGGKPYHFKAYTTNPAITSDDVEEFKRVLGTVKRLSAWLDEIVLDLSTPPAEVFVGHWIHTGDFITLQRATM